MAILSLSDYPTFMNRCVLGQLRLVAYGISAIATFSYPIRFDYFISINEAGEDLPDFARKFWISKPIETLAQEDPSKTLIIVCGGSQEAAWKAVGKFGDFSVMPYFSYEFMSPYLPVLGTLPKDYRRGQKKKSAKRAIILRGQLNHENNLSAVEKVASDHPNDYVVLSTWADSPRTLLDRAADICDNLVTSEKPPYAGSQNRNFQNTLARAGLRQAQTSGAEKCLISRTDILLSRAAMLDGFDMLMEKYPLAPAAQARQKGRMIVPNLYTRRCLPYHASDILTYGWLDDVSAFWSAGDYDDRSTTSVEYLNKGMETTLDSCVRSKTLVEIYFWLSYIEKMGLRPLHTVADWIDFLRDYLIITDMHAQRILWFGKDLRDLTSPMSLYKSCFSATDWADFSYSSPGPLAQLDLNKITWKSFVDAL